MCRVSVSLALALLLAALAGCGGPGVVVTATPTPETITVVVTSGPPAGAEVVVITPEAPPQPEAGIEVLEATFAHGLSEEMAPVDPGADFAPGETVYLSVKIKGRPKSGVVTARFYLGDTLLVEGSADLADVNSGLIFSIGENTYGGYSLTHTEPLPVSDNYRADLFYDGAPLGSAPFRVIPPEGAIPSQITQVVLAKGADADYNPVEPSTVFSSSQAVFLVGRGDFGLATWVEANWYVSGQLDSKGTRSFTLEENGQDVAFAFSFVPDGGWPAGEHRVVLIMNDREVGRYAFTIQ